MSSLHSIQRMARGPPPKGDRPDADERPGVAVKEVFVKCRS